MKKIILLFTFLAINIPALADETECYRTLDIQLNDMWAKTSYAGSITYKKLMAQLTSCVEKGQCYKTETLIGLQEIMLDEEFISLQKKKISALKLALENSKGSKNPCILIKHLPAAISTIEEINKQQYSRLELITEQLVNNSLKTK